MKLQGKAKVLRIFVGAADRVNGTPLYELIVYSAKRYQLAGATLFFGAMGYGTSSIISSAISSPETDNRPAVIEIIDESEKINQFMSTLEKFLASGRFGCIMTTEVLDVTIYKPQSVC